MYVLYVFLIDKKQRRERIDRCYLNKNGYFHPVFNPSLLLAVFAKQLIIFFWAFSFKSG